MVLDDGEKLSCDLVIVAAGVRSAVAGFEDSGILIDRGIQVNDYLETSVKDVYAAGDVTGLSGICQMLRSRAKLQLRIWSLAINISMKTALPQRTPLISLAWFLCVWEN